MKNQIIEGVFCDIQGTLLDYEDKINIEVLEILKRYEKEGKIINLWTGGEIEEYQEKIWKLGIKYPILSKYNFKDSIVEIAIDDMPKRNFQKKYGIKAKKFVLYKNKFW